MSHSIRNNTNIKGIIYKNKEIKLVSFADDANFLVSGTKDAKILFRYLGLFEKMSGLKLNKKRLMDYGLVVCVLTPVHRLALNGLLY